MNSNSDNGKNGYLEMIRKGISAVQFFDSCFSSGIGSRDERIERLKTVLESAEAIVIGAGAGLSASAGLMYSGERFHRYFFDFEKAFGITDMYTGGFYPFPDEETRWAWWARHIWFNRYVDAPKPVYRKLLSLVKAKDYFVITTNVDHQFQRAGFDKQRLFYTQGDYGLFQSMNPQDRKTYDNEAWVIRAMEAMGFARNDDGVFRLPDDGRIAMRIPAALIPKCPDGGGPVTMNLRADDGFVEDEGWHKASAACSEFLCRHAKMRTLYLEIGVGANTPVIIKYPFWAMTAENPKAIYACLNYDESFCPKQIESRSVCIDGDAAQLFERL